MPINPPNWFPKCAPRSHNALQEPSGAVAGAIIDDLGRYNWHFDFNTRYPMRQLLFILILPILAFAQGVTGSLSGRVLDGSGAAIPDARLLIEADGTAARINAATNDRGEFVIRSLIPGSYSIEVRRQGFDTLRLQGVIVKLGAEASVVLTLKPAATSGSVTVTAQADELLTAGAQVGNNFSAEKIAALPVALANQGLDRILTLTPGVVGDFNGGSGNANGTRLSANGATGRSNNFNVDGQDVNEITTTGPAVFTNHVDAVAEYQISTNNYSAEFGQATGAVVNIVTKSGTNDVHGTATYFYRNQKLFDTLTNLERRIGLKEAPPETTQTFGATLGGPIRRNRLFYFGSYQGVRQPSSQLVQSGPSGLTPTPRGLDTLRGVAAPNIRSLIDRAAPFRIAEGNPEIQPDVAVRNVPIVVNGQSIPVEFGAIQRFVRRPFTEDQYGIRLDWTRDHWKLFGRYFDQDRFTQNSGGSAANGFLADLGFTGRQAGFTAIFIANSKITNESRIHFGRLQRRLGGGQMPAFNELDQAVTNIVLPAGYLGWGPGTNQPDGRTNDTLQLVNLTSIQAGRHFLRLGVDARRRWNDLFFLPVANGQFTFASLNAFAANQPSQASVTYGQAGYSVPDLQHYYFVQDDWRVRRDLTLYLGLRYERFGQPINRLHEATLTRESARETALFNPMLPVEARIVPRLGADSNNFAPRVGFAYSPDIDFWLFAKGKGVLRGGYGIGYDIPFYNILLNMQSSAPSALATTISQQAALSLPSDPTGPGVRAALRSFAPIGILDPRLLNQTVVAPDFRSPMSHQWNITYQRRLGRPWVIEAAWVANRTSSILRSVNGNPRIDTIARDFPAFLPAGSQPAANGRLNGTQGFVRLRNNNAKSAYHSLQTRLDYRGKRTVAGFTYTLASQKDSSVDVFGGAGGSSVPQDPFRPIAGEFGRGFLDFRNTATAFYQVALPGFNRFRLRPITSGWSLNGTVILRSRQPYTVQQFNFGSIYTDREFNNSPIGPGGFDGPLRPFTGNPQAPANSVALDDVTARTRFPALVGSSSPTGYYDFVALREGRLIAITPQEARFIVNTTETARRFNNPYGNEPRNSLFGGDLANWNLSVAKDTKVAERVTLQFRADALNVLNRPSFGQPNARLDNAGVGFANLDDTNGGRRQLQFGLRLIF